MLAYWVLQYLQPGRTRRRASATSHSSSGRGHPGRGPRAFMCVASLSYCAGFCLLLLPQGSALCVDIQGVGDLYTDPQIHTLDGQGYGDGNLALRGEGPGFAAVRGSSMLCISKVCWFCSACAVHDAASHLLGCAGMHYCVTLSAWRRQPAAARCGWLLHRVALCAGRMGGGGRSRGRSRGGVAGRGGGGV